MLKSMYRPMVGFVMILSLFFSPLGAMAQATPAASPTSESRIQSSADWLVSQQAADGGWLGFSGTSDTGTTIDAVLALSAARNAGATVDLTNATTFLQANAAAYADTGSGAAAKVVLVAKALGLDGRNFAGIDPFKVAIANYNGSTNLYGTGVYDTALVVLAYGALDEEVPGIIIQSFKDLQIGDGSWAFDGTTTTGNGDTNTTAIVIQALISTNETDGDLIMHGLEYLEGAQLADGFPFQTGAGAAADGNSTGIVVQALIAAGEDPTAEKWQNVAGSLERFQNPDGSFTYLFDPRDENLYATVQLLPALARQPFPIQPAKDAKPVLLPTCTPVQKATPPADDLQCAA
jgi:hypothetical protein